MDAKINVASQFVRVHSVVVRRQQQERGASGRIASIVRKPVSADAQPALSFNPLQDPGPWDAAGQIHGAFLFETTLLS